MKSGYDIRQIKDEGYLIIPLSMSRLATGQSPEVCYKLIQYFAKKLETFSSDVILLYTGGMYFNAEDVSFELRKKLNQQTIQHISELRKMITSKKEFIPGAFHFLSVDYVIMNSPDFKEFFTKLKKLSGEDKKFKELLIKDSKNKKESEANMNFLLEEIAIAHIIRQRMVEFPRTLVKNDIWRLIVYPGKPLLSDIYQWKNKFLPQRDKINPFNGSQYNFDKKTIHVFDEEKI